MTVHLSFVGAVLALLFSLSVGGILWWMLHPPRPSLAEKAAEISEKAAQILVGFRGSPISEKLLEVACILAKGQNSDLAALYVIELPMTLPLEADVPQEEARAQAALARARKVADKLGVPIRTEIRRARKAGRAIVEAARAKPTRTIVLGASESRRNLEDRIFGSTADFVLRHARCDVLIEKPARAE